MITISELSKKTGVKEQHIYETSLKVRHHYQNEVIGDIELNFIQARFVTMEIIDDVTNCMTWLNSNRQAYAQNEDEDIIKM